MHAQHVWSRKEVILPLGPLTCSLAGKQTGPPPDFDAASAEQALMSGYSLRSYCSAFRQGCHIGLLHGFVPSQLARIADNDLSAGVWWVAVYGQSVPREGDSTRPSNIITNASTRAATAIACNPAAHTGQDARLVGLVRGHVAGGNVSRATLQQWSMRTTTTC